LTDAPIMPEWNDKLTLPPTYEEYLKKQNEEQNND
jgi:general secretion pathway protein D